MFIDEAYALVDDRRGMFGDEAINMIVSEMENMREDVAVVFAGYPNEMRSFLERNPGLDSRIAFHIHFPDYSPDELTRIIQLQAKRRYRTLTRSALDLLKTDFTRAARTANFGNGQYVRNLLDQAILNQGSRLIRADPDCVDKAMLQTLEACDFLREQAYSASAPRAIGFR